MTEGKYERNYTKLKYLKHAYLGKCMHMYESETLTSAR